MKIIITTSSEINKNFNEKLNELMSLSKEFSNKIRNQFSSYHENYCIREINNIDIVISNINFIN